MTRFQDWETQLVPTVNGRIFFRYAGKGQPILLLHGVPQHSLMYHSIAPALVSKGFLAIVPELPGFGQSIVNKGAPLTSKNAADALHTVMKFLDLKELHIFAFDKGTGPAILLARDYPNIIKGLVIAEYALPGFGHEIAQQPSRGQTIFDHWHLGLFTLPEVAVFLIRGREEEFLTWYYWHTSYSGHNALPDELFQQYVKEWRRPGGVEAAAEFLGGSVWADMEEFDCFKKGTRLQQRLLVMGGEASMGRDGILEASWNGISAEPLETVIVPKAGHWIDTENPHFVAERVVEWIGQLGRPIQEVDFSWLDANYKDRIQAVEAAVKRATITFHVGIH
ncbi:hypothetical protein A1O7_01350 [Cladophialophora yegresii CBS 114405]|uniref:AB hydrolase-1 domain-containing protein n=1 Tax=Cladophialophora yegresii CBS 114405 TaxID=1182544 RepID=W9WK66_9EURO|nr:uncharacterized protein A1O7_01350 [Cladophialophora yegresii CBS 114405]EXJ65011.1 hypothetical protein A1O7_01350 [Cladophialophora yegresii CBS 114405]